MNLQDLFEQLNHEIQNKLNEIKAIEAREEAVLFDERTIQAKTKSFNDKVLLFNRSISDLEQQKEFVKRKLSEIEKKEKIAQELIDQAEKIKQQLSDVDSKKKELAVREFNLKEEKEKLRQEGVELERREGLIVKSVAIDTERKAALDRQEEENAKERKRLQNIAVQYEK